MKREIILSHESLSSKAIDRHQALRDYFCDKDASVTQVSEGWKLELYWPGGIDRHIDPRLAEGLRWWGGGISLSMMSLAYRRQGLILETLYDTWTLHSWSEWLSRQSASDVECVILHVDDHRDLASPRLIFGNANFLDAITEDEFDLSDPRSVEASIISGAVGMGSFMTPFLHVYPNSEVRHLCQPPKVTQTLDYKLNLTVDIDTLLQVGAERPSISLSPLGPEEKFGKGCYRSTLVMEDWLSGLDRKDTRPIFLHIDMDYFNNRFDGDSDWSLSSTRLDPPNQEVIRQIEKFTAMLLKAEIGPRVVDVVIAYSPGFFPAELWESASQKIQQGLRLAGIR